jgi:hypothetical protein
VEAITRASATARKQNELQKILEAKQLVSEGDTLLSAQSFLAAADKYQAAVRKL